MATCPWIQATTLKVLRETFKYLPTDGKQHLSEDIIEAGMHNKLHQLAQSVVTGLLAPIRVAGSADFKTETTDTEDEGSQQLREDALRRDENKCICVGPIRLPVE